MVRYLYEALVSVTSSIDRAAERAVPNGHSTGAGAAITTTESVEGVTWLLWKGSARPFPRCQYVVDHYRDFLTGALQNLLRNPSRCIAVPLE